ncbi:MAG TPA: hypothetical protein VJG29_00600 [Candidatus Paceibacterota bacterium]
MRSRILNWGGAALFFLIFLSFFLLVLLAGDSARSLLPEDRPSFAGTLHLTLAREGGTPRLYSFKPEEGLLLMDKNITPFLDITKTTARGGKIIAVATAYDATDMSIDTLDLTTGEFALVSKNKLAYKREPVWSADGKSLAYIAADKGGGDSSVPDYWQIFVTDQSGKDQFIDRGTNPVLSPDGSQILYVQKDGLHRRALTATTSELVWPVAHARSDMKLSLSFNGKRLAWSNRTGEEGKGEIVLFSVSWRPFSLKVAGEFQLPATYIAFSPDGETLAAVVPGYDFSPLPDALQILFISFDDAHIDAALDLSGFDPSNAWLTQWTS